MSLVPALPLLWHCTPTTTVGNRRAVWQEYFGQLLPDELAAEGGRFTTIELIQVGRGGAEYEMLREEARRVFSYPIALVADVDGRWRLWQF